MIIELAMGMYAILCLKIAFSELYDDQHCVSYMMICLNSHGLYVLIFLFLFCWVSPCTRVVLSSRFTF
jgi:hypothetical protein